MIFGKNVALESIAQTLWDVNMREGGKTHKKSRFFEHLGAILVDKRGAR
jgi:hypothetical protein